MYTVSIEKLVNRDFLTVIHWAEDVLGWEVQTWNFYVNLQQTPNLTITFDNEHDALLFKLRWI